MAGGTFRIIVVLIIVLALQSLAQSSGINSEIALFATAKTNALAAAEAFERSHRFVQGWLGHADPRTGLIPRNLTKDVDLWNGKDSAADNYPFMVLTCAMTDRTLFCGKMRDILKTEIKLTRRLGSLGDNYLFSKAGFAYEKIDFDRLAFDNSEYVKDGLVPITEWLGASAWSDRAVKLLNDIWKYAPLETPFGKIPTTNFEVNGDLLQACSRLFWFSGEQKYLDWAIRLGDYYLLADHHPIRNMDKLRLLDHGCEVINGLSELYLALSYVRPQKKLEYEKPMRVIFDSILQYGRNADGLLYSWFNPQDGSHSAGLCDTWGYVYDGFYSMYLVDHVEEYRQAVQTTLARLNGNYVGACWDDKSADGFADSIEGALNLINREPIESAAKWIDSQTRLMWDKQKPDGIIEGWHGDGNFARTSLMYALWKTQGLHIEPWRADVKIGAVQRDSRLYVVVQADMPWQGKIFFDRPRHGLQMHMPVDYPRINQFPEWFTVAERSRYLVKDVESNQEHIRRGKQLGTGLQLELQAASEKHLVVDPL
jgi:hypothetical protein